ncbi:MAG TPA: S-adenosylmethionine:tRNA ribosyltransferase-isomerase [Acidimicrobiales bacterium]|nr:S-adenosylmethionine:tRNA ribosyltransferase-isomerase [Acidimicrobiales bacterium]
MAEAPHTEVLHRRVHVADPDPAASDRPPEGPSDGVVPMDAYDYGLPESAIAQRPVEPRSAARLLVGPGVDGHDEPGHSTMADLPRLLRPGDVVVVNDTRVLPARLELQKTTGGAAEVLLLEPHGGDPVHWWALVRPGRRLPPGTLLVEDSGGAPAVEVGGPSDEGVGSSSGRRLVRLVEPTVVERRGQLPLPPYIRQALDDPERYQTVYARRRPVGDSSVAAPTAGLHFTRELLASCETAGARVVRLDLLVGLDTFRPVSAPTPAGHVMHSERFSVPAETWAACRSASRVVAVGTTVVRALETVAATGRLAGRTDLFIWGPYPFRVVDVLLTNFHVPRSTLLLLVESFCGPVWRTLYATALAEGYRFLSFGDAMIVVRNETPSTRRDPGLTRRA